MSLFRKGAKQAPQFYCDNCGAEVEQNARGCHKCGRSFSSVRCPVCNFVGEVKVFDNGCPSCGYSAPKTPGQAPAVEHEPPPRAAPDALPLWVYLVSGAACAGALVFVLRMIMR